MGFEGSSNLYIDLVKHEGPGWGPRVSGCKGLAGIFARSRQVLSRVGSPRDSVATAAIGAMDLGTRGSNAVPLIFCCLQESLRKQNSAGSFVSEPTPSSTPMDTYSTL